MGDCKYEYGFRLVDVKQGIGKRTFEVATDWPADEAVALWRAAHLCHHGCHGDSKTVSERMAFSVVNRSGLQHLCSRFRVEDEGLHRAMR